MTYAQKLCTQGCGRYISARPSAWRNHTNNCKGPASDGRSRNSGTPLRASYTVAFKWKVLRTLEEMQERAKEEQHLLKISPVVDVAEMYGVAHSLVSKWKGRKKEIIEQAKTSRQRRKRRLCGSRYRFADVDAVGMAEFKCVYPVSLHPSSACLRVSL